MNFELFTFSGFMMERIFFAADFSRSPLRFRSHDMTLPLRSRSAHAALTCSVPVAVWRLTSYGVHFPVLECLQSYSYHYWHCNRSIYLIT